MEPRRLHKAKRIDSKEWVEGYYVDVENTGDPFEWCGHGHRIVSKGSFYEIYPYTLCQCAGKKDAIDSDIYENDILSLVVNRDLKLISVYRNNEWQFRWLNGAERGKYSEEMSSRNYIIIGNIHD